MLNAKITPFPYTDWSTAAEQDCVNTIATWFENNYKREPQQTMQCLLDYVFEVLHNAHGVAVYSNVIRELGLKLKGSKVLLATTSRKNPHHLKIILLLELGIQSRHSHFFMLPQINKQSLLTRADYSSIILAAKFCASGEYQKAREIALSIAKGCSLAQYIIGQSERKLGLYDQAQIHLNQGLDLINESHCVCPFGKSAASICNEPLLKAVMLRARATVCRSLGQIDEAYTAIDTASIIADEVMRMELSKDSTNYPESKETLWVDQGNKTSRFAAVNVAADIYFSYGYYWYQELNYEQAGKFFYKAILALEQSDEKWDAPYTRLAIVKFCEGDYEQAKAMFSKAHTISEETSIQANREAPLSLSLCSLGLKVIESFYPDRLLIANDPLTDLDKAIRLYPKLAFGPLECHLKDAKLFLKVSLPDSTKNLVHTFINRLIEEIKKINPSSSFITVPSFEVILPTLNEKSRGTTTFDSHSKKSTTERLIMEKTVVELDLKGYSDIALELEEHLSAEVVMRFNDQIQSFIDAVLTSIGVSKERAVMATTGDGAILAFDEPITGHVFAEAIHNACRIHNHSRTLKSAKRWFRIGIATGELSLEEDDRGRKMAGSVIARSVRLEAAADVGEILIDTATYVLLPSDVQARYGTEEEIKGKRAEKFPARRYVVVAGLELTGENSSPKSSKQAQPVASEAEAVLTLRKKIAFLQNELAKVASAAQKFELKCQIEETQQMLLELGG